MPLSKGNDEDYEQHNLAGRPHALGKRNDGQESARAGAHRDGERFRTAAVPG
jgi:hypothetical protein